MSVRNSEETLSEALNSIREQTYSNWELIICDDASSDRTPELLKAVSDELGGERVKIVTNETNRRLAYSLNRCLELVSGDYIARMDADDVSEPNRFETQLGFLEAHPHVDLVGTAMRRFSENGLAEVMYPPETEPDRWTMSRSSTAFFHATVMTRRDTFSRAGNYTVSWRTERSEDADLWFKFFAVGLVGRNLNEPLYLVREDAAAIRRRTRRTRIGDYATRIHGSRLLGYPPSAYIRSTINLLKIFIPYRVFDLHRQWTARRESNASVGRGIE